MDELRELAKFRNDTPDPDHAQVRENKKKLVAAIENQQSADASAIPRSAWRPVLGVVFVAGVVAAVAIGIVGLPDGAKESARDLSLNEFRDETARNVLSEVPPLSSKDITLEELEAGTESLNTEPLKSDVIGIGKVVDLRLAYKEVFKNEGDGSTDEIQHMFLVVEPDTLESGAELLGESRQVLIDVIAPPIDRKTGDRGLDELRNVLVGAPERVAFFLSASDIADRDNPADVFAGRSEDDPLLVPTHPSVVLALDEEARVAFPLLEFGRLEAVPGNLAYLRSLGAEVDRFASGESAAEEEAP